MGIPVFAFLCFVVGGPFLWMGWEHAALYGVNVAAQSLILFLCINILICFWELCLCYRYSLIRSTVLKRQKEENGLPLILFRDMGPQDVFSPSFWANIWIDYGKYDPSYGDSTTFGYCVDVGNGHTTLLPSLYLLWTLFHPGAGPKVTGMVGLVAHYQMLYGTVLYLYSYFNNRRFKGNTLGEVVAFVLVPSLVWVLFPLVGMYGSAQLILQDSFQAWRAGGALQ